MKNPANISIPTADSSERLDPKSSTGYLIRAVTYNIKEKDVSDRPNESYRPKLSLGRDRPQAGKVDQPTASLRMSLDGRAINVGAVGWRSRYCSTESVSSSVSEALVSGCQRTITMPTQRTTLLSTLGL